MRGAFFRIAGQASSASCHCHSRHRAIQDIAESRLYKHEGEEIHIILKGKVEYMVGETSYILKKGDVLWHPSDLPHKAKNLEKDKSSYLTIGSPPTFM